MAKVYSKQLLIAVAIASLLVGSISCRAIATTGEFYGSTTPPQRNILRYVNGDEPESLDPPVSSGQPEARIYMALYEGLVEYDPKTLAAIPALAERWHANGDSSEFVFYLRKNARWSNGDPINAHDFVYSIRRALSPQTASRSAGQGHLIKYAQAYNSGGLFVRDPATGQFLLEKDLAEAGSVANEPESQKALTTPE